VEARYIQGSDDVSIQERLRLRVEYNIPQSNNWSIIASDEISVNLDNQHNNQLQASISQNQAYIAIGYKLTKHIKLESGYLQQRITGFDGKSDANNNVWMSYVTFNY
jgi:hypothetical protein